MSGQDPMLDVARVSVRVGPVDILTGVSLDVGPGTAVGLVGPNGAGKTTLLDAISGLVPLASGSVRLAGVDVSRQPPHRRARLGLGRTFQNLDLFDDLTVDENLQVVAEATASGIAAEATASGIAAEATASGIAAEATSSGGARTVTNLGPRLPGALAHHERKDVALARALAGAPRVLLLDEPAAGLDASGRETLVATLRGLVAGGMALVVADHDLDLVLAVCDRVLVLDLGRVIADLPPSAVRSDPEVISAYLGPPADTTRDAAPRAQAPVGDVLLTAHGLAAGYGGGRAVEGLDLDVREGEVVAVLGPNGAGKTTTLRALSGSLPLAGGAATAVGVPVDGRPHRLAKRGLAHVPQDRAVLRSLTVAENLRLAARGDARARAEAIADALRRFPVLQAALDRRAGRLSGGEQQLLALTRAFASRPRLLFVDELSLGLAPSAADAALRAVREAATGGGVGVLLVEQHPGLALRVADRVVVLALGRPVFSGPTADLPPGLLEAAYLGRPAS